MDWTSLVDRKTRQNRMAGACNRLSLQFHGAAGHRFLPERCSAPNSRLVMVVRLSDRSSCASQTQDAVLPAPSASLPRMETTQISHPIHPFLVGDDSSSSTPDTFGCFAALELFEWPH